MRALRQGFIVIALLTFVGVSAPPASARSVGQVIDDTVVTTEVKAKLTAEKLSNLTKIEVKTENGVVTLNGVVDTMDRKVRAEQIAASVNGVRGIVNSIHVAGSTIAPSGTAASSATLPSPAPVDATGIVASVDAATGTVVLEDGRVLRLASQTVVWQPATLQSLRPGTQVYVRDATPVAVQPSLNASVAQPEWRMGTVRSVDRGGQALVMTDGTVVRITPTTTLRRGNDRIALDQIAPGTEIVMRAAPRSSSGGAEGSAFPGAMPAVDASDINVVWTPVGSQ
jgi:hypothetical protein